MSLALDEAEFKKGREFKTRVGGAGMEIEWCKKIHLVCDI
jgi:hypothetical protein